MQEKTIYCETVETPCGVSHETVAYVLKKITPRDVAFSLNNGTCTFSGENKCSVESVAAQFARYAALWPVVRNIFQAEMQANKHGEGY